MAPNSLWTYYSTNYWCYLLTKYTNYWCYNCLYLALDISAFLCYNVDDGEGGEFMAIRYKVDIMAELKQKGYSSTKIREEKLIGQSYLQQIRHGDLVSWKTLDTICSLLDCQPGDLIEYVREADVNERG